jgi:EmrB/QacA subfamily drug resistance transporter
VLSPRSLTLAATALGSGIAFLDTTVVIVALPSIEADLGLGLGGQQWVVLGYALALSALYLPSGAIGDRLGLRRTFIAGAVLFALASMTCALAHSETWLVTGRVLQGIGGAALTTASLALLRVVWEGEEGRAIGLWTSITSMATIAGPALGGVLVELSSWRWIFLANGPLAVVVIALALAGKTEGETVHRRATLDPIGSALAAAGLAGLSFAFVELNRRGFADVAPIAAAGGVALVGLWLWTVRAADPLVPPGLLRCPGLAAANAVTLIVYAALAAHLLLFPVYLQFLGFSAIVAGLSFTLPSIALVVLAPRAGTLADTLGPRRPILAGCVVIAVSFCLFLPIDDRSSALRWGVVGLAVFAVGLAAVVAPITAAALSPAPTELAGVASGLNQTVARAGGVLSVAGVGALASFVFERSGGGGETPFDPESTGLDRAAGVDAFRASIVAIALIAAAAALASLSLRDRRRSSPPGA